MCYDEFSVWFNVEYYLSTHSTQYRCTHYTLLSTARCFQSVCSSVTPWCVILFSTNSSPLTSKLSPRTAPQPTTPPSPRIYCIPSRDFLLVCGEYVPLKRRSTSTRPHGAMPQTDIFKFAAWDLKSNRPWSLPYINLSDWSINNLCRYHSVSLPTSNPSRFVADGVNALGRQTELWSTEAKVWGIVPKTAWHWGGDSIVTNDPFEAPGSTLSYACLPP
jgi:hypothetical protein